MSRIINDELKLSTYQEVASEAADWPRRVNLFGIQIDAVNMSESVRVLLDWAFSESDRCRYAVTPNVDHVVMLQENSALRAAYADAGLVVADGWPVVAAARWLGQPLPERVAGSDLVPRLFDAVPPSATLRVYLLGAAPGVGLRAAHNIQWQWPCVRVVGVDSPPLGFEHRTEINDAILAGIETAAPDLLVIGLGAPKQELWVHTHQARLKAKAAICAGATIDFLAGEKQRAPRWMRRAGLEWLHRLSTEPRRLARRYFRDAIVFPQLVWSERRK